MARLIVEAVPDEEGGVDQVNVLLIYVSVSRADDGTSVTGLKLQNFRITSSIGNIAKISIGSVAETKWETADVELSGCYKLGIIKDPQSKWVKGYFYAFGIQVMTLQKVGHEGAVVPVDFGQTVVSVQSLGQ
jgi:hypothetical protein